MQDPVLELGQRLFADHADAASAAHPADVRAGACAWMPDLWDKVEELGLPLALVPEQAGGYGIAAGTALGLVRSAAAYAIPLPFGETIVANWLLATVGLPLADGPATLAIGPTFEGKRLVGEAQRVAYGRNCGTVVIHSGEHLIRVGPGELIDASHNLAGEPRDTMSWQGQVEGRSTPVDLATFRLLAATVRAQGMAGALSRALSMTIEHANVRQQFGKPIGRFQAIQQQLAVMAGQVAAARAAADMASALLPDALDGSGRFVAAAMAAKIRAGEGASTGAAIAHQVHAAIGFTQEYRLHLLTRRLWAWRDEWGREAEWAEQLGGTVASFGRNRLWQFVTSMGARDE